MSEEKRAVDQRVAIEGDRVILLFDMTGLSINTNLIHNDTVVGVAPVPIKSGELKVVLTAAQAREYARRIVALADVLEPKGSERC